jgi:dTDP-glucose 4,6-dehydratase
MLLIGKDCQVLRNVVVINLIMNWAAESHVDNSISAPKQFLQTNTVGTFNLLEASRNYLSEKNKDRNSFRFHQVSTDEVYGDLYPLTENKTLVQRFDEQTSYSPSSPYSASKAAADHLVSSWGRTYKMQTLITTCSNNYGPFQHKEKLIPKVISKVLNNEPIPVYGDGQQIRDWLYVEDHVRALWAVAEGGVSGSTYAIGGSNEQKNIDVVRSLCGILDELCPGRDTHQRLIEFVDDRPGHDRHYAIDSSKIRKELGWHPRKNFNEGLRETVLSFLS